MTVSYNSDVSSVSSSNFLKLLLRWKGSIWKSVSSEFFIWCISYILVAFLYHWFLFPYGYYDAFNDIAYYCGKDLHSYIPLTFMLAFFVSIIVERWRTILANLGWIETTALTLNAIIVSRSDEARLIKRGIVRYLILSQILTYRDISIRVRRRFPNLDSIRKAGFMTEEEEEILETIDLDYNKYWVPINWAIGLVNRANEKGYVVSPPGMINLITEIKAFRSALATLCTFDWCPIPIAYPQNKDFEPVQLFIRPLITIIELICIIGWMKVAEALLNPLGEDDDDFESNYLIDKNIFTGMRIVDCSDVYPTLVQDIFSDPGAMPIYSAESQKNHTNGALVGSVSNVTLAQFDENIQMVPVAPRNSIGEINAHDRTSIRRRFKTGTASQSASRASSFREPRLHHQNSIGESNDGYELDYDINLEDLGSPSRRNANFFSNLAKVDEIEEHSSPATAKTSVVSRV
ncbi:hypothetical protein CAEBREN_15400 [Caenorhabditis brenneri]|uniref:Bestrophin homolog n=1 Tax=Caenorhabditis brenneri TaxID=135651 RepID=G0NM23_CAEBE|nr:hypothetical protein CAEBREN_15400 [Caenorhabditis brenneri]